MSDAITWHTPPGELADALDKYGERALVAIAAVGQHAATAMQNRAQADAPWTDRTGNARAGLFGTAEMDKEQGMVVIYLSHGVVIDYGVYLELAHGGQYKVVMPTILGYLPELNRMLAEVFA